MSLQNLSYAQHHPRLSLVAEAPSPRPDDGRAYAQNIRASWAREEETLANLNAEYDAGSSRRNSNTGYSQVSTRRNSIAEYLGPIRKDSNAEHKSSPPTRINSKAEYSAGLLPERKTPQPDYTPIRRRSFLQHGVATRATWTENDPRLSLPPQARDINYYYDTSKSITPPLSDIASFRVESPGPRTMTPTDLGYGHTGAYKIGTLRITNGAASPVPDSTDLTGTGHSENESWSREDFSPPKDDYDGKRVQEESTLREREDMMSHRAVWTAETLLRRDLTIETHLTPPEFASFNFNSKDSPTRAMDFAKDYADELGSPFSFDYSPPISPTLETTSKSMAADDDLFEEEISPIQESRNIVKAREQLPSKLDSGYSSYISLRSFKALPVQMNDMVPVSADQSYMDIPEPFREAPPVPVKDSLLQPPASLGQTSDVISAINYRRHAAPLPPVEVQEKSRKDVPVPKHAFPPVPVETPEQFKEGPPIPSVLAEFQQFAPQVSVGKNAHPANARQQSLPIVKLTKEPLSPSTSTSTSSTTSSKWRKRPHSVQPPIFTVQALHSTSELSIPPVPATISRHLEEKVDGFPLTSFPNTRNALRRSSSKETLGTIFSVGNAEVKDEPTFARLQSELPAIPRVPVPKLNRRYTYQPPIKTQEEFETEALSYANISASLGNSPYHVATPVKGISMTAQLESNLASQYACARTQTPESARSAPRSRAIYSQRLPAGKERIKSPPPVSLQSRKPVPPSRTPPVPPADPWKDQKNFWSGRRKSAGEALSRKSVEIRPKTSLSQQRPRELKSYSSWDASYGEYNHTYGTEKENDISQDEYYENADLEIPTIQQPSTSDMLTVDRFAGGLGYGYDPGVGLSGSAGMRNSGYLAGGMKKSVDVSMQYGLDFSDVPIIMQRVRVSG
jgi:hypothetical protein